MGILDLSLVTETLINLLTCYFSTAPEKKVNKPDILSQRPDKLTGDAVGFYLYHVCEDPNFKNLSSPDDHTAPARFTPMGLQLYYQLVTQYATVPNAVDASIYEQNMMGIAMKALHDFSIIDENTTIVGSTYPNETVFVTYLKGTGTRLRIELLSIDQKDAIGYWATSNAAPRLAAYYKVSVVFLKQDPLPSRTGRVLTYGINTFVGMGPRIDGCSNTLSFRLPGKTDMNAIELRPAQVPFGEIALFYGLGLIGGEIELLLKNAEWEKPLVVDTAWELKLSEKEASIKVQESIKVKGQVDLVPILPGIYSATIKVKKQIIQPDGTKREIEHLSNECPFAISPRIDSIKDNTGGIFDIDGYCFSSIDKDTSKQLIYIQVYIGQTKLPEGSGTGTFSLLALDLLNPDKKTLRVQTGLSKGIYPIRIFANGVESSPNWITIS